jgi:predicted permease
MLLAISKIIPILLLIGFGFYLNNRHRISEEVIPTLRKGIVNIALPAVLFLTFKNMTIEKEFYLVTVIVLIMLTLFYSVGYFVSKTAYMHTNLTPFFMTSTAFGTIGITLYSAVFGMDQLAHYTIFGIGHEFFVWFIYLTLIRQHFEKTRFSIKTIKGFAESPLVIAIVLGIAMNLSGIGSRINSNFLWMGIETTLEYLASLITPMLLIIIGHTLKIERAYIREASKLVIVRLLIMLSLGYLVKWLVIDALVDTNLFFDFGYFTFLILPPPFSLSVFVGEYESKENEAILSNALVLSTIVCVVLFIIGVFYIQ